MTTITFSDAACAHVRKLLARNKQAHFRLSITKTGCSGYAYAPELVDDISSADKLVNVAQDVTVYLDAKWLSVFNNLHVDFLEDNKSGLKQKRLVFVNPNETARCGCGESFHIEDNQDKISKNSNKEIANAQG